MKDGRSFVASSERGGIQFCDSSDGTTLSRFRPWQGFVQNVDMTNDGRYLGTAVVEHPYEIGPTVKKHVHIWNTQRNQLDQKIQVDCNSIDCLDFSPSGKRLAAAASLDTYVWDRESGRRISKTSSKSGGVWTVALDRDGDRVAIGTINGLLAIVHAESGKEIFSFQKICECIGAVEFVENKEQLIIGRYRSDDIKEFDFVKERFNCSSQYLI
jgi:WD40 repeat protein